MKLSELVKTIQEEIDQWGDKELIREIAPGIYSVVRSVDFYRTPLVSPDGTVYLIQTTQHDLDNRD